MYRDCLRTIFHVHVIVVVLVCMCMCSFSCSCVFAAAHTQVPAPLRCPPRVRATGDTGGIHAPASEWEGHPPELR